MSFDSNKFTIHNVSSKIPTSVSMFRRSASFRVPEERLQSSETIPLPIDKNKQSSDVASWKQNLTSLNFTGSRTFRSNYDDDLESVGSFASNFSATTNASTCDHAHFAKNGTTFSGKTHKYIVHCSSSLNDTDEYLTPTQRANRNITRLKTLLQLAKEKLREKEEEIYKLNKEVTELKLFKATVENSTDSPVISAKDPLELPNSNDDLSPQEGTSQDFVCEKFNELSPIKHIAEDTRNTAKMSPTFSQEGFGDKTSTTPDFFLSSLADSGNFDDLPSSASLYSKDSASFIATPELRGEQSNFLNDLEEQEEEDKVKIVKMYEKKLGEKKEEYESELNRVIREQQQRNLNIILEFEKKLKEEELKFESRWNELLKATEEEKILIVNRFEEKLGEEREKYKESLKNFNFEDKKVSDIMFDSMYAQKMEEEKKIYETSLMDIKKKFENEKFIIEEKFDAAMREERLKFEESMKSIQEIGDKQVNVLTNKISELETEYFELLPKYEKSVSRNEELEKENEALKASLNQQEEQHKKMYLELYKKSLESGKFEVEGQKEEESGENSSTKISVPELFAQLKITEVELENLKAMYKRLAEAQAKSARKEKSENDPEATLQFLKSAVYYFLTDRENHLGHLKAIESILAFSSAEKNNIEKLYLNNY